MILQRLTEYADQLDLPPAGYQPVAVRYIIELDQAGRHPNIQDTKTAELKRGQVRIVPELRRTMTPKPKLLCDNPEYVLGLAREKSKPGRVRELHASFVEMVRDCASATGEPTVGAVLHFLEQLDLATLQLPEGFDPTGVMTFQVDDIYPVTLPAVRAFWARVAAGSLDEEDEEDDGTGDQDQGETPAMECLVCGQMRVPVKRMPIAIKKIPGPQPSLALISANTAAFSSYGLKAALIASTCRDCALRFSNALNALIQQEATHLYVSPLVYIFWTREAAAGFVPGKVLEEANTDDVQQFLTAPWRSSPEGARLALSPFYAASLSASGSRVVVRGWIETTLEEAQRHLERYFMLQRMRDAYTGQLRWFGIRQLAYATVNTYAKNESPPAEVVADLLHAALHGGRLPLELLYQAVRRARSEQGVTAARAALIKMVLLSQRDNGGDKTMSDVGDMPELSAKERQAYQCGRLLAVMEEVQRETLGDVSATIVDRYYGTASSAPASVFGRLMRGTQAHMGRLRRERPGAYGAIDRRLQDILADLPTFPATLTLRDQGLFGLGFYHQRAESTRARIAYAAAKQQPSTTTI